MEDDQAANRDVCPVCKSTPLTQPGLRFKINNKCYHRICEGCVDRKFSAGKSGCPVAHCTTQLWKRDWKIQTFEDLKIEREVDIRRRVTKSLDRDEVEFETKRDYDDFLELREELIMNLVFKTDVNSTNRKIRNYEIANGIKIKSNAEEDQEALKKITAKFDPDAADPSGLIKGLKKKLVIAPRSPYDPFKGMPTTTDYYELRPDYDSRYDKMKTDMSFVAGGYDFQQYWDESLLRAFAGLGVFMEDESKKDQTLVVRPNSSAMKAADDVF